MRTRSIDDRDVPQLLARLNAGATYRQVADWYSQTYRVPVSLDTVRRTALKHGFQPRNATCEDLVKLRVPEEHLMDPEARRLRAYARRLADLPLSDDDATRLDLWLAKLKPEDLVVGWDASLVQEDPGDAPEDRGWYYTPRRPGIDLGVIREPD